MRTFRYWLSIAFATLGPMSTICHAEMVHFATVGDTSHINKYISALQSVDNFLEPSPTPSVVFILAHSGTSRVTIENMIESKIIHINPFPLSDEAFSDKDIWGDSCFNTFSRDKNRIDIVVDYINVDRLRKCKILQCMDGAISGFLSNDLTFKPRHSLAELCPDEYPLLRHSLQESPQK